MRTDARVRAAIHDALARPRGRRRVLFPGFQRERSRAARRVGERDHRRLDAELVVELERMLDAAAARMLGV